MNEEKSIKVAEAREIQSSEITPMTLIAMAQSGDVSIEKMEQLFELQLKWEKNEALKKFNAAVSNFKNECPVIRKTRDAYSSKYAGLAEAIETIKPFMAKNGLSHRWNTEQDGNKITVECTVSHSAGHSESTKLSSNPDTTGSKNSIQAIGSAVSYLERYTLFAILGLASTDHDDDGKGTDDPDRFINESQIADIYALIEEVKADENKYLDFIGFDSVERIEKNKYAFCIKALEDKRGKK